MKSAFVRLGAVACLLGFGAAAHAQYPGVSFSGVSYTFLDAQASFGKIDLPSALGGGRLDATGPYVNGSLAMNKYVHLIAGWERLNPDNIRVDDGLGNITTIQTDDIDTYQFGVGFNTPTLGRAERQYRGGLLDRYSLFADARYQGRDSGGTQSGWALNAGFRSVNFTRLEFIGGFGYEKFENVDGSMTLQAQLLFRIVRNLQLRGGVNWSDDLSRWNLGFRYHFGDWSLFGRK